MPMPGMKEYLDNSVEVPEDTSTEEGDGTDVSKEVNPDGEPLSDEDQERTRLDPWNIVRDEMQAGVASMGATIGSFPRSSVEEYSKTWKDDGPEAPYCPVYVSKLPEKGRLFEAYITGGIEDTDDYLDLIDTLLTASEDDKYIIYIDSPGGMIAAGGLIASAIHHSRASVITIARGLCASAGALVHSSAKKGKALCTPFAVMMYHMSSHWDGGYSTLVAERALNQVRYVNECLLNKAVDDGHITQDEFEAIQHGKDIFVPATKFERRIAGDSADDDTLPGQESFSSNPNGKIALSMMESMKLPMWPEEMSFEEMQARMDKQASTNGKQSALLIRTGDKKNYRVYMKASSWFTQNYINGLCRFLDSRKEGETVTFVMGVKMNDWQAHILGAIVSAMIRCKATVNTIAAGYCSIPETMLWCFGQNRDVYRYGALSFGVTTIVNTCKDYRPYFEVFFQKAIEIGIITEEDVQNIWDTGSEKLILQPEYRKVFPE